MSTISNLSDNINAVLSEIGSLGNKNAEELSELDSKLAAYTVAK